MGWGIWGTIGRTMLFMPAIISWVVTGALWKLIFDPNLGSLNTLLGNVGLAALPAKLARRPEHVLWSIGVVAVWQQFGLYVIIFYAGLQGLDATLLEAAAIDGANARQRLLHVTVPLLRPVTLMVITLNLLNGIKLFDVIWVMTEGGPVNASQVLGTYMYRVAFANPGLPEFGYGSALSTVIMTLCVFAVLVPDLDEQALECLSLLAKPGEHCDTHSTPAPAQVSLHARSDRRVHHPGMLVPC